MAEDWVVPRSTHIYNQFGLSGFLGKGVTKERNFNCSAFYTYIYTHKLKKGRSKMPLDGTK